MRGWRPRRRASDWFTEVFLGYQVVPNVGAWFWMKSPSLPATIAKPVKPPWARSTPLTAWTVGTSDSGTGGRVELFPPLFPAALNGSRRAYDGVDTFRRVREEIVEDVAERVGEDERARHEGDAEHDCE